MRRNFVWGKGVLTWQWFFILLCSFCVGYALAFGLDPKSRCSAILVHKGPSIVFVGQDVAVMNSRGYLIVDFKREEKQSTWVGEFSSYVCEN